MALSTVVFLKEKRDGSIKTRACVNGAPQRKIWSKEDAASPTPHLESVFLVAGISAWQHRKNRCFDIPSAFPTTDTDEEVIMVLKGELADYLIKMHPAIYQPFAIVDARGRTLLYVRLQKALYGLMRAALLFVVWHVDDVYASCVDDFELTKFACYLGDIYGPKLTMHTGTKFDYLGMNLDFGGDGGVEIDMFKHVDKLLEDFPEEITGKAATPAAKHCGVPDDQGQGT